MPERRQADPDDRFEDEFARCWLPVFRFALAWTNDWAGAEDLAQEAFARLWARRADVDWSAPMLPWLLTTTRRLATDRFRRLRRLTGLDGFSGGPAGGGSSGALDHSAHLRWLDVQRAMAGLTPLQRSALVLVTVVGLDTQTAGQALGISAGAVRAAVSRARALLADA
jgi:RNA polymerase sigma-70 factor, ECF subfamily